MLFDLSCFAGDAEETLSWKYVRYNRSSEHIKPSSLPNKNFELGKLRISRVFSNFTEVSKCQKNGAITRILFLSAITKGLKKVFLFLAIFDKNNGHRVTKFYPFYSIYITYKFYFMIFFSSSKKIFHVFFIYAIVTSMIREGGIE